MERLQGISLDKLVENLQAKRPQMPNRLLWRFLQCLVRIVTALAFPPGRPYGAATENPTRESKPTRDPTSDDYQIYPNDDNLQNYIFDKQGGDEHELAPMIKLIDFGSAIDDHAKFAGTLPAGVTASTITSANIYQIGNVMRRLYFHMNTPYFNALFPGIDTELVDLLNRCATPTDADRIGLVALWDAVEDNVARKTGPNSFADKSKRQQDVESDAAVGEFVHEWILSGYSNTQ